MKNSLKTKVSEYNDISDQCRDKRQMLDNLETQLEMIKKSAEVSESTEEKLIRLTDENQEWQMKIDMEQLQQQQLNHITKRDKLDLLYMQQPIQDKKDHIRDIMNSIKSINELK